MVARTRLGKHGGARTAQGRFDGKLPTHAVAASVGASTRAAGKIVRVISLAASIGSAAAASGSVGIASSGGATSALTRLGAYGGPRTVQGRFDGKAGGPVTVHTISAAVGTSPGAGGSAVRVVGLSGSVRARGATIGAARRTLHVAAHTGAQDAVGANASAPVTAIVARVGTVAAVGARLTIARSLSASLSNAPGAAVSRPRAARALKGAIRSVAATGGAVARVMHFAAAVESRATAAAATFVAPAVRHTIPERVLLNIEATLDSIAVANGFDHDVVEVSRIDEFGPMFEAYPSISIAEGRGSDSVLLTSSVDRVAGTLDVEIALWVRKDATRATVANALLKDVERALMVDPKRGGLAVDTRLLGSFLTAPEAIDPLAVHVMRVEIDMRHDYDDAFAQGGVQGATFGAFPIAAPAQGNATSVRERVVADLAAGLALISQANGYQNDVVDVTREPVGPWSFEALPGVSIVEAAESKSEPMPGVILCELSIVVLGWDHNADDQEALAQDVNNLLGDIKNAVLADPRRGGEALTTSVVHNAQNVSDVPRPYGGHELGVEIKYRHGRQDPTVAR